MNTTRHTFSVTHCDNINNTGNCTTLSAAKSLANKHGSDAIFIRGATLTTKTDTLYMVFTPREGWAFIDATEDDFAERATPTKVHHLTATGRYAGTPYCGIDRTHCDDNHVFSHAPYADIQEWSFKDNLCPKCKAEWLGVDEVSETATVYSMDVARVEDETLAVLNESISVVDGSLDDFTFDEIMELYIKLKEDLEFDDIHLDLPSGDVRIICRKQIDTIWTESLIEQIKDCYDLDEVPSFIVIDWEQTAENCKVDGLGHHFNGYDGNEYETTNHYIFRTD